MATRGEGHAAALRRAREVCEARDVHLSAAHQTVLRLLLDAPRPLSAYSLRPLFEAAAGRPAKPITIYRLLDFLLRQGLVVRIESQRAYAVVADPRGGGAAALLLCDACGRCDEIDPGEAAPLLAARAEGRGFRPSRAVIELHGRCADCAARA